MKTEEQMLNDLNTASTEFVKYVQKVFLDLPPMLKNIPSVIAMKQDAKDIIEKIEATTEPTIKAYYLYILESIIDCLQATGEGTLQFLIELRDQAKNN